MAIKIFITYAGLLLAGSVTLWALIKQFASGFAAMKRTMLYGILTSAFMSVAGFLVTLLTSDLFIVFWILTGIFLIGGAMHTLAFHKKFRKEAEQEESAKVFIGELFFALSVALFTLAAFSAMQYFLKDKSFMFYPILLGALAFFVPFLVAHTFDAAYAIPQALFSTWTYPTGRPLDPPDEKEGERLLVIAFEIAKKETDATKTSFRARAPEGIPLGELYYHFINDYNEVQSETPIQFMNKHNEPQVWWFRLKPKWYQGQRILDPALTVKDNGIVENSIIICERADNVA
jgi:hypothetical protein